MKPPIIVDDASFDPNPEDISAAVVDGKLVIDKKEPWDITFYIGAYDGDLMSGFIDGTITLPFKVEK